MLTSRGIWQARRWLGVGACVFPLMGGCTHFNGWFARHKNEPAGEGIVVRAGRVEPERGGRSSEHGPLAEAEDLFRQEKYADAENRFHKIAANTSNPPLVAERARYYEAECLRLQGKLPEAVDTYHKLMIDFPAGVYREQAVLRTFDIARVWLQPTLEEIDAELKGQKKSILRTNFIHFDKSKPTFDLEGRALQALENCHFNDPTGPVSDKALYLIGYVHFYRGNFREADQYLTQLIETQKDSEYRDKAIELAIIAKNNCTGGPEYDGRKSAEALRLIMNARATSPKLNKDGKEFLDNQMQVIRYQQAEKDFRIAEFYERTNVAGSAYFYYHLVMRRYPGTKFAQEAQLRAEKLEQLRAEGKINEDLTSYENPVITRLRKSWRRLWNLEPQPLPDTADGQAEVQPQRTAAARENSPAMPRSLPSELAPPR